MLDKLMADGRVAVHGIYFDVGTADIRPESSNALSAISVLLQQRAALRVIIEAHTDNVGSAERNQQLSLARAVAVMAFLKSKGVGAEQLQAVGCGSTQPIVPNDTPANRQRNRRIELVLQPMMEAQ